MEHHKISKLLNDSTVSKCVTRKWIEVNHSTGGQYSVNKNIRFKTSMLRSDLCDYSDASIVVKKIVTVKGTNDANKISKMLVFNKHNSRLNHTYQKSIKN